MLAVLVESPEPSDFQWHIVCPLEREIELRYGMFTGGTPFAAVFFAGKLLAILDIGLA